MAAANQSTRGSEGGDAVIETPEQLRAEIAYRIDERIGIITLGAMPSKSVVELATLEAYQWADNNYPEIYKTYVENNAKTAQAKA